MMRRLIYSRKKNNFDFVSTWNTANLSTDSTNSNQIKLPLFSTGIYNFEVFWGDGNSDLITTWNQTETTHTYASSGIYQIKIKGTIRGFSFNSVTDRLKILSIESWGSLQQTSGIGRWFLNCANLNLSSTADILDLSTTNNFSEAFSGCTSITTINRISEWDFSTIAFMGSSFLNSNFNTDISNINVPLLQNASSCFRGSPYNFPINWITPNLTNVNSMFRSPSSFNQNIGNLNVSNVTNFESFMLGKAPANFSASNLDAIYNGWTDRSLQASRIISFGSIKHTSASTEGKALLTRTASIKTITNAVNNGSGLIRIFATAHGLSTGNKCFISGVVGTTEANGGWFVTVIDANTVDLVGSTFTNAYTSGGTLRTGYGWTITDGGI